MFVKSIDYPEKLIQSGFNDFGTNICFDFERYCGGCSWTEINQETGEIKFASVNGWTVVERRIKTGRNWRTTNQIIDCPLFIQTPERNVEYV